MSKYTTELRFICEQLAGEKESVDYSKMDEVIEKARVKIFDFNYPYFSADQKKITETNIIQHFYTSEIGAETFGRWKLFLRNKMNLIMPKYVEMFRTADIISLQDLLDKLNTVDYTRTVDEDTTETIDSQVDFTGDKDVTENLSNTYSATGTSHDAATTTNNTESNTDGSVTSNGTNSNTNYNLYSNTPNGALNGVNTETYLSDARKITNNGSSSDTSETDTTTTTEASGSAITDSNTSNNSTTVNENTKAEDVQNRTKTDADNAGTRDLVETVKGRKGNESYLKLIEEYRNLIWNIDELICYELEDLFMLMW